MQTTKTDRQTALRITTNRLLELDKQIKKLQGEKERLRSSFFQLANEELLDSRLMDRQLIQIPANENLVQHVEKEYPGWVIQQTIEGSPMAVIEEDPSYLKFSYVNPDNDMVFSRQVAQVGVQFDAEGFFKSHPTLAASCVIEETVYRLDEAVAEKMTEDDPESVTAFQQFTSRGTLQRKLASPRKATEDDLA